MRDDEFPGAVAEKLAYYYKRMQIYFLSQKDLQEFFLQQVTDNDVEFIQLSISRGADINFKDKHNNTPLHKAAKCGNFEAVYLLMVAGASIDEVNVFGETPLYNAIKCRNIGRAKILLDNSSIVGIPDILSHAWGKLLDEKLKIVKVLAQAGANLNVEDAKGNTPLYIAVDQGLFDAVQVLVRKGTEINNENYQGKTSLYRAVELGDYNLVTYLLAYKADPNITTNDKIALHFALENEYYDIASLLIRKGADVNIRDLRGISPLYKIANSSSDEMSVDKVGIAKFLLQKGADVNLGDNLGTNPLHKAVAKKNTVMVELLLDNGADINAEGLYGTPIEYAAINQDVELVSFLLEKGVLYDENNEFIQSVLQQMQQKAVEAQSESVTSDDITNDGNISAPDIQLSGQEGDAIDDA